MLSIMANLNISQDVANKRIRNYTAGQILSPIASCRNAGIVTVLLLTSTPLGGGILRCGERSFLNDIARFDLEKLMSLFK